MLLIFDVLRSPNVLVLPAPNVSHCNMDSSAAVALSLALNNGQCCVYLGLESLPILRLPAGDHKPSPTTVSHIYVYIM